MNFPRREHCPTDYRLTSILYWLLAMCVVAMCVVTMCLVATPSYAATKADRKPFTVVIEQAYLDLRTGAGKAYPVFYVAQRGESLAITKSRTQWYRVHLDTNGGRQVTGWVHRRDLAHTSVAGRGMKSPEHPFLKADFIPRLQGSYALGRIEGADLLSLNMGYQSLKSLIFEGRASWYNGVREQGWLANVQLRYQPFYRWRISPFVTTGYGYLQRETRGTLIEQSDESDQFLTAGAGFSIRMTKQYHLRLEYSQLNTLTSTDDNKELDTWQIGLATSF